MATCDHLIPPEPAYRSGKELILHYLSRLSGISSTGFDPQILSRLRGIGARPSKRMIQKELLNPGFRRGRLSKQSDTYRTIAGTLETGKAQVIDVFDEPPSPSGFGGGTKIVLRKPIDEKESNGKGKKEKASV